MSTAPRMKPVKGAGKQKISAQTASGAPDNPSTKTAILSPFKQAQLAIRRGYLGPSEGEHGKVGRLVDETKQCETSTKRAILEADPTEKLPAFNSGFNQLQERLCASATACYGEFFELAVSARAELDTPPADFASSFTHACFSTFLRISALDGAEESREINSNGRVRWFVRHACSDYSDEYPRRYGLRAGQSAPFRLQQWFSLTWMVRDVVAKRRGYPNGFTVAPATDLLSMEETEEFILNKEQILIKGLRDTIAEAHRIALVNLGKSGITTEVLSKTGPENRAAAAPHVADPRPRQEDMSFSEDERTIYCCGESLPATKQQVLFIKALHTAWKNGQPELTNIQLAKASGCSKTRVTDTFRGPGEKFRHRFVETVSKGRYKLKLPFSPE